MGTQFPDIFAALAEPFNEADVKFREGQNGGHYIKAPTAMNRLDEVLGPENWWDSYRIIDELTVECSLSIRLPDGQVVTKFDVGLRKPAKDGRIDPGCSWKAGYSDTLKRAVVKFGVARHLCKCGIVDYGIGRPIEQSPEKRPSTNGHPGPRDAPSNGRREKDRTEWGKGSGNGNGAVAIGSPPMPPPASARAPANGDSPRTGKALFAWCKDQEERYGAGLLKYLAGWMKRQSLSCRIVDLPADQVNIVYSEAVRKLRAIGEDSAHE